MEGGVMISRSYGSVDPFDRAVKQLRQHFALLLSPQKPRPTDAKKTKSKR
jgi:TetR/AcrR family transcriptional regulator, transcriptional repressor for nem operon